MNKIYVVNQGAHNYETAKKYGELIPVTEAHFPIFKITLLTETLRQKLKNFDDDDLLLLSGPAWLNIVAATMLLTKFDSVKFLVFDAKQQSYIMRHLSKDTLCLDI
jgi:hypothetical protein